MSGTLKCAGPVRPSAFQSVRDILPEFYLKNTILGLVNCSAPGRL